MTGNGAVTLPKMPSSPAHPLPAGACDTHTHVFGPYDRFPVHHPPAYDLLTASAATHREAMEALGVSRAVLVQPGPYGDDCSAIVEAIARNPGALRGIGAAGAEVSQQELERLRAAGICGLRFVEITLPSGAGRFAGAHGFDDLVALAPRMREHGFHAQVWADCHRVAADADLLAGLGVPVVIEHMARAVVAKGVADPDFQAVLRLLQAGQVWVKLQVCRVSPGYPDYPEVRPFHDALLAANPHRLLWGSDWPYVNMGNPPDAGRIADLFHAWTDGDAAVQHRILVENPQRLYGFGPP